MRRLLVLLKSFSVYFIIKRKHSQAHGHTHTPDTLAQGK